MRVGINGRFFGKRITGVQRFGHGILPLLQANADVCVFLPAGTQHGVAGDVVMGKLKGHAWEQFELVPAARRHGCDVVLHPANTLPLARHRSVVVVHDAFPLEQPQWFDRRFALLYRHVVAPAVRRASAIVTVSEFARGQIAHALRLPRDRITVAPSGLVPFDRPAPAEQVLQTVRKYDLPERFVLALGGRDPRKNIRFLGPLAEALARRGESVCFAVIGDAHARVHPADHAPAGSAALRFLGHVEDADAHALLTGAAALCFPSLGEGLGRPPLEALACGTPVLVSNYPAALETLPEGTHVLPLDAELWAQRLSEVLHDAAARENAAAAGRQLRAYFNWESAAAAVLEVCATVAGRREVYV